MSGGSLLGFSTVEVVAPHIFEEDFRLPEMKKWNLTNGTQDSNHRTLQQRRRARF
jgi:hypothetical protein